MHNAPTVNYPLGRSRFQAWLTAGTCLLALLAGLLWCTQVGATGWRQGVWLFGWLTSSLLAFQSWRQTPVGVLRWDGESWCWVREAHSTSGALAVHIDFQFFMLLSLRPPTGSRIWLWPERNANLPLWNALRRAVFSQPKPHRSDRRGAVQARSVQGP